MRRSLPSPPLSVSLLSAPVSTSSPAPPLSCTPATSVFFASTVIASLPLPPFTVTATVPLAGTVCGPGVALSQSVPSDRPPVVCPCTSRPPDTDTVTLLSVLSRFSVAVVPSNEAEVAAASAGPAVAPSAAASAAPLSTARMVLRFTSSPLSRVACTRGDPGTRAFLSHLGAWPRHELESCCGHGRRDRPSAHRALPPTSTPEHCAAPGDRPCAHAGIASVSSSARRRLRIAYHARLLTVPSGTPLASAISRMVMPSKWARRTTSRCSGLSRASAVVT